MSITKDKIGFEKCIPETIEIAQYWLWLKKNPKDKIIESFNNLRGEDNEKRQ